MLAHRAATLKLAIDGGYFSARLLWSQNRPSPIPAPSRLVLLRGPAASTSARTRDSVEGKRRPARHHDDLDSPRMQSLIKKQLHHFRDPFHLAKHVDLRLKEGRFEEALDITEKASVRGQYVVSWNFLIKYLLQQQRLRAAIKLFNEMKKRGQRPNAQTFTAIFSGCAKSDNPDIAVAESLRLYRAMLNNGRVEPNTIHLNAVIHTCARAKDIESMFSIVDTCNETTRAPTQVTYTTLIHALRIQAEAEGGPDRNETRAGQPAENQSQALQRCKALWDEVIRKWRRGKVAIDEKLVCAMGRALLVGGQDDKLAILNLLHQTMDIPDLRVSESNHHASPDPVPSTPPPGLSPRPKLRYRTEAERVTHVRPGNNTLSLVIQALVLARSNDLVIEYWKLLTLGHGIIPDSNNWHWLTVAFKRCGSSARVTDVLREIPPRHLNSTIFVMAIETCLRDGNDPNVYTNADAIIGMMNRSLEWPDPEALRNYFVLLQRKLKKTVELVGRNPKAQKAHYETAYASVDRVWKSFYKDLCAVDGRGSPRTAPRRLDRAEHDDETEEHYQEEEDGGYDAYDQEATRIIAAAHELRSLFDLFLSRAILDREAEETIRDHLNFLHRPVFAPDRPLERFSARRDQDGWMDLARGQSRALGAVF